MKINISGISFEVKEYEQSSRVDMTMGRCDITTATINVSKMLNEEMKKNTIIHEWIHGVLDMNGFGEESNSEKLVNCLANELYRQGFFPKEK